MTTFPKLTFLVACASLITTANLARAADTSPSTAALTASALRCEYLTNPIGMDDPRPRLSWTLASDRRGASQSAYQIVVASTAALLEAGTPDLWDTGKVNSSEQNQIEYAGKPMTSRQQCVWRVRTWDEAGNPGPWSATASWEVGLQNAADWQAKFIVEPDVKPAGKVEIVTAKYGSKDVLNLVRSKMVDGRLDLVVSNETLGGDPSPNKTKQLTIRYKLDGGPELQVPLREKSHVWLPTLPPQVLRRAFNVSRPVVKARLYATALGLYALRLNGQPLGNEIFTPDWTDYRKRVRYQAYDVTPLLHQGANAIGGTIANGFYSGHIANGNFQFYGTRPALMAQLELTYADGTIERIGTDDQWRSHPGPVQASDIMMGEDADARTALDGSIPDLAVGADWLPVKVKTDNLPPAISPEVSEPVRELMTLPAKTVTEPEPGHYLFDLGQNMVGVERLRLSAPAGTRVTVRFAEMLQPDGGIYTKNYRAAASIDTYTCRGNSVETWQPQFTYHGFRYVELTGLPAKPDLNAVTGVVLGSDTPSVGTFTCSDRRINQLWSNIRWGQRGNFFGVPTDCPQRDERLGWMGDAQVFIGTAVYNADVAAFFSKWLVDVDDEQLPDGRFTSTSPDTALVASGVPGWGDAGVICPWTVYRTYGDKRELALHLPAMMRWVDWSQEHSTNLIRDKDRGSDFGDWLAIGAKTSKELLGTAYFAHCADLVSRSAKVLGDEQNAAKYAQLFEQIKDAYHQKYFAADGSMIDGTQTTYALSLAFDLLPQSDRAAAAQRLANDVKGHGNHLSTGFLGVSYLLPALSNHGQTDTAFMLLMQDTFPSWLFSIRHGATTIWERWDGWTPEKGFQSPGMNSFNHYSLGSCGQWLYEQVAGMAQPADESGFSHVIVHPHIGGGLTHVAAAYNSVRGTVSTAWKIDAGRFTLDVTVPPNVTAVVNVPTAAPSAVEESGSPALKAAGVKLIATDSTSAQFEIRSGTYHFAAPAALDDHRKQQPQ